MKVIIASRSRNRMSHLSAMIKRTLCLALKWRMSLVKACMLTLISMMM